MTPRMIYVQQGVMDAQSLDPVRRLSNQSVDPLGNIRIPWKLSPLSTRESGVGFSCTFHHCRLGIVQRSRGWSLRVPRSDWLIGTVARAGITAGQKSPTSVVVHFELTRRYGSAFFCPYMARTGMSTWMSTLDIRLMSCAREAVHIHVPSSTMPAVISRKRRPFKLL
jgi:hypothetical protein